MFLFGVQYVAELSDRYLTFTTDLFLATQPPDEGEEGDRPGIPEPPDA